MRFYGLDGVRGLAALMVLISHLANLSPALYPDQPGLPGGLLRMWLVNTPLHALWDGHAAVLVFFVISGFVLTPAFLKALPPAYPKWITNRWIRIWLPYAVALTLAAVASWFVPRADVATGFSVIPAALWRSGTTTDLWASLSLVGTFNPGHFNGVIWSLVHEMRVSLILPLLVAVIVRWPALALPVLAGVSVYAGQHTYQQEVTLLGTARYLMAFALGIVLFVHRDRFTRWFGRLQMREVMLISALVIGLSTLMWWTQLPGVVRRVSPHSGLTDWLHLPLAAWLITLAIAEGRARMWLETPVPQFLGKISYSLYLIHLPVILVGLHLGVGLLPLPILLGVIVLAVFAAAVLLHRYVEAPAHKLGRYVSNHVSPGLIQADASTPPS